MSQPAKSVVIPLYEGVELLDVAGPGEVFSVANIKAGYPYYQLHYLCHQPRGWVRSSAALELRGAPPDAMPQLVDILLVPGANQPYLDAVLDDAKFLSLIARAADNCVRCTSVCSGAFLLGAVGRLDERRVTTHWAGVRELSRRYPRARVSQDRLFQRDGNLWTSAGVLSGVDMTLAIVREDLGAEIALKVARELVVFLVREGGQSQFSAPINLQNQAAGNALGELISWLQARLSGSVTVAAMAAHMAVSVRTLHRRCQAAFGMTPVQLLAELRLERARALLHNMAVPIKKIAFECGFASQPALTKAFTRRFGVAPSRYRDNFHEAVPAR